MRHHHRHVLRFFRDRRRELAAGAVLIAAVALFAIGRGAFVSPEVKFTDASASGLHIVPASCPSNPYDADAPNGCSGDQPILLCPDGSQAPNNDTNQCTCAQGNASACPPPPPNLSAGSVSPVSVTVGAQTVFTAPVSNTGGSSTGSGFSDLLQVANDAGGSGAQDVGVYDSAPLAAGQSNTSSFAYTPDTVGTTYMRVCADKSSASSPGVVSESNEADNCGSWTAVTVSNVAKCQDGSLAPGGNASTCSCSQGNLAACGSSCPDGSAAPGGNSAQCTCAQGNTYQCGIANGACTDPNSCAAPSSVPGCRIAISPKSARAGDTVQVGWASACASASDGCTSFGLPEVASGVLFTETVGGVTQSLKSVQPSGVSWDVPAGEPATFKISGQLYAGYWPILVPVSGTSYSCQVTLAAVQTVCPDGSAPVNGVCTSVANSCNQSGYPRCSPDGSSIQYVDAACHVQSTPCPWASQGYGCVSGQCLVPPNAAGTFDISPKLVSTGASAIISWNLGTGTSCAIVASNGDNSSNLTGSGSRQTIAIVGQTTYTLNCTQSLTGQSIPPQSVTVNVTPTFQEQ